MSVPVSDAGMNRAFENKKVFLFSGPGGVGKTTLAASFAVALARRGHRTVVLTVDPAKRLAQALGFGGFASDLEPIRLPDAPEAVLYATMLDSQRYFDRVMSRFAKSDAQREKILSHPLYRLSIDYLGGTHEYAAMERLLEFAGDSRFDKVIVDTPPTQNAVDLLTAPQRLADFLDSSVLRWFRKGDRPTFQIFRQGTKLAMKILQRILGGDFLDNLADFLGSLEGMEGGFQERNLQVVQLLRHPTTAFLLVSHPTEARYLESESFLRTLRGSAIPLSGLILNRLEPLPPREVGRVDALSPENRDAATRVLGYQQELYRHESDWVARFESLAAGVPLLRIPRQGGELHDLPGISRLGELLIK